jgi:hypothetical protein
MFEKVTGVVAGLAARRDRQQSLKVQIPSTASKAAVGRRSVYKRPGDEI